MALFDFMGKDVGGYNNAVNDPNGLGISQGAGNTGVTWGQLIGAAMQQGSKGGSSGPAFGSMMRQQYPSTVPTYDTTGQIPPIGGQQKKQDSSYGAILALLQAFL